MNPSTTQPGQPALPDLHVRPRRGWLNDPNGVTFHGGRWHVFFQHNPKAAVHDLIHWGHVSSSDLLTWTEHPVAFGPEPGGPDRFGCWSGVFVPGLERGAVAYSGVVDSGLQSTVCLRWALDEELETWSPPVVVATTPAGAGVRVMRDPFVFDLGGRRWALLGAGMDDGTPSVLLYSCDDILDWRFVGVLLDHGDEVARRVAPADIWECPQLVVVDGVAVLVLALQHEGRLDTAVALTGSLDLTDGIPTLQVDDGFRLDTGEIFYAPQVCTSGDGLGPLMLGWLRQEDLVADPDGADLVAGCLSLPRRIVLRDGRITSILDPGVAATAGTTTRASGVVQLPRTARVDVAAPWTLTGSSGALPGDIGAAQVWVDGEVVEVYPADGSTPYSARQVGTTSWRLETADATVTELPVPERR